MAERSVCTVPNCTEHYACRLRSKGMQISPRAQSTRTLNWRPTPSIPPAANARLAYDVRPDGSKMPILGPDGTHIHEVTYRERQHQNDALIHHRRSQVA